MQIGEPSSQQYITPVWRLAFRAGFLLAAGFAVVAMLRWLYWIELPASWSGPLAPHWWHGHEMIFGFAMPVVSGFLLTAVATWTGTRGTSGWRLQLLFSLWLLARLVLWLLPAHSWLACAAEMLFILFTMLELGTRVCPARQWRNILLLPVLLVLGVLSLASYRLAGDPLASTRLHYGALWMIVVLVVIIGGRVIPLFTSNRLGLKIKPLPAWFEYSVIAATALVAALTALGLTPGAGNWLPAAYLLVALLHCYRVACWQGWKTTAVPLLWSMHLSYLCIPVALFALAAAGTDPIATKNIIHLLAIGTVGGMILAMMSRVSLGHTSRPLEVPAYLAVAFAAVIIAALVRAGLPVIDSTLTPWAWRLSGALWAASFSLFLLRYIPVLCSARADGKAG